MRRLATANGVTPAYLLAPEVSALLFYMPDLRNYMLFSTFWNTGVRIGESRTLTPESFDLDGLRPFVKVLSEKVRARCGRPLKDEVRLVPLTDETMRNWLKMAIARAEADGVIFFHPGDTAHISPQLYHAHALSPPAEESDSGAGWP